MHLVTHTEKVTQCLWLASKEKLLFLLRRNLKRLLFDKFHAFMKPNLDKSWFCYIEINAVFKKERSITAWCQHPLLLILTYGNAQSDAILSKKNYLTVCDFEILPNTVCFCNFTFRLIEISIAAQNLAGQCRKSDQTSKKRIAKKPNSITGLDKRLKMCNISCGCSSPNFTITSLYQEELLIQVSIYPSLYIKRLGSVFFFTCESGDSVSVTQQLSQAHGAWWK